jgi:excisionase family DNA binding protein
MEKQADPLPFLTPGQAAKLLNLPTHRIHHLIYSKKLPALKVGTQWRIPTSERV